MEPHTVFNAGLLALGTNPQPPVEAYLPASRNANRRALVIFPGGGYGHLSAHEGRGYAEYFAEAGFACFVVYYRLGTDGFRHPAMIEDAVAAVHSVRSRAGEFGFNRDQVGVVGSSAGGHLAASLMVHFQHYLDIADCRPDFGVLCYPVISLSGPYSHGGSRANLLGEPADPVSLEQLCCEKQVSPDTPPCFLWHTAEDEPVPMQNSLLFADALHKAGVPCELHVYARGRHGLGLEAPYPWAAEAIRFINDSFPARAAENGNPAPS